MVIIMDRPIPHDPRVPAVTPADVEKRLAEVLGREVSSLVEEAAVLEEAHAVLSEALQ